MPDLLTATEGRAGRITLNRPKALNALTHQMCLDIEATLDAWANDPAIELILIDASGDRAFCAGGDIAKMYETGMAGDYSYGRQFWQDEYRLNAKIAHYSKPIVSFLQGFTMGGGVGIGCHASHRIVGETSQIAMPEVSIGLVPDVGGSLLLAHAPGQLGAYLGVTAARMDAGNAIYAGFADHFIPEESWPALKSTLAERGVEALASHPAPAPSLANDADSLKDIFATSNLPEVAERAQGTDIAKRLARHSPLAMACALKIIERLTDTRDITEALNLEYRFTARSMEHGDFLEGIRAQIIDKDKNPAWRHDPHTLQDSDVDQMLAPLGAEELNLEEPA
ncbi:MAG: enoyl-CoA hydratase/isomerase family protein [Pseudomonadota bacterium]